MRRPLIVASCAALLLAPPLARSAAAQTGSHVDWNEADTLANVQGYTFTWKVDGGAPIPLTATCTLPASATLVACTAPIPTPPNGSHTYVLTASNAFGSAGATVSGAPPATPGGLKITIIVTVSPVDEEEP